MTLSTTTVRASVIGSGAAGPFSFAFKVFAATDLLVQKTGTTGIVTALNYPTDYTVAGVGNALGGTLTLTVALAVGESLSILRATPNTQPTSFRSLGTFFPASHEDEFDRLTMLVQQNADAIKRSARIVSALDPSVVSMELTPVTGQVLGWTSPTTLGTFTLDSSAVALPGNGRTTTTLSALLANNIPYTASDYGAKGDGVTNDAAAIQAALNATSAAGGGRVVLRYTSAGYNIGSASPGLTVPKNVTLECESGIALLTYAGTGIGVETRGASYVVLRNLYVLCTQDAAIGIAYGGTVVDASRWCRMENVTAQGSGTLTNTGAAFLLDSGPQFCAYLNGRNVYGLGFKYGIKLVGQSVGANTWTTINFNGLTLVGRSAGVVTGSRGIFADANTNLQSSGIRGGVIESFEKPFDYSGAAGTYAFNFEGGCESNTNAPTFPAFFNGQHYDNHADLFYRQSTNQASFSWFREKIASGQWYTESFDDRLHTLADGSGFDQFWGLRRGGSTIDGTVQDDKFIVATGQSTIVSPERNWWKLLEYKFAVGGAIPTTGAWKIGSVVFNNAPTNGNPLGWVCQSSGTIRSATGVTATTTSGSPTVTVSAVGNLLRNDFITIAGAFANPTRIRHISGTTLTMESNASGSVSGISVVYPAPVFRPYGWAPGPTANKGDASVTLSATDPTTVRFDTALTANRTVTLPANGSSDHGQKFRITRTGLGAFTLTVQDAASTVLKAMPSATAAWCDVEFNANTSTWQLAAYGTL